MTTTITKTIGFTLSVLLAAPAFAELSDGVGLTGTSEASESALQPGDRIPGRYILTLAPSIPDMLGLADLQASVESLLVAVGGGDILHVYRTAMTGAAVTMTEPQAALLSSLPGVLAVEPDQVVAANAVTQGDATWGLDRIDQPVLPLDEQYSYPSSAGNGVSVYILSLIHI